MAEAGAEFVRRAAGTWRLERIQATPVGDAYVTQTLVITDTVDILVVEAFGDPDGTIPLLKYESSGPYSVVGRSVVADAFELDLTNDESLLTVFVDDPAFQQSLGIDDCDLEVGVPKDVSNGCGAPLLTVTNCVDMDLFQVADGSNELRTGEPGVDRCVERPSAVNPDAYALVERSDP